MFKPRLTVRRLRREHPSWRDGEIMRELLFSRPVTYEELKRDGITDPFREIEDMRAWGYEIEVIEQFSDIWPYGDKYKKTMFVMKNLPEYRGGGPF